MSKPIFYYHEGSCRMYDEDFYLYLENGYTFHYSFYLKGPSGTLSLEKEDEGIFYLEIGNQECNDLFYFLVKLKEQEDLTDEAIEFFVKWREKFIEYKGCFDTEKTDEYFWLY